MKKKSENSGQVSPIVAVLTQGQEGTFWLTLKKLLQEEIDAITDKILNDDSLSEKPREMTLRDIARLERTKMIWLLEYPSNKAEELSRKSIEQDESEL